MEAVRTDALTSARPDDLFRHVLSMPVACPGCNEQWILLTDSPIALEIEMGLAGKVHLRILAKALSDECIAKADRNHFRTDGKTVWVPGEQPASHLATVSVHDRTKALVELPDSNDQWLEKSETEETLQQPLR